MTTGIQTTLRGLLDLHGAVVVPLIQRDYAQGREGEQEVREEFIDALASALVLPTDDPRLPLNLDFIYGSLEGREQRSFQPLDGQQRLTTLFLLHWYCAWQDDAWEAFVSFFRLPTGDSRFSYQVRTSSTEFFDALVDFRPHHAPDEVGSVSTLITDQPWYFRSWRLDPSVQSTLVMLDSLHSRFKKHRGLFERLMDLASPAVTFQLLDLEHFGLSDDLYIKMNARGKPLTQFETFKARYVLELKSKFPNHRFSMDGQSFSAADYVSRRMDIAWADLFWSMRDANSDTYDAALMNVIRAFALISRNPDDAAFADDVTTLRSAPPTYTDFHTKGWLDLPFTRTLVCLLDQWSGDGGRLRTLLRTAAHFDEKSTFERIARSGSSQSYTDIVQLAAYAGTITTHESIDTLKFEQWMRVVTNLSVNTSYRQEDLRRSLAALKGLLPHALDIESFLAQPNVELSGFNEQQIAEERLKATLLLADSNWRPLIDRAEAHPYLRGQIEFLLAFAGIVEAAKARLPAEWDPETHSQLQSRYLHYLALAEQMFGANGLKPLPDAKWERALLSLGDYLMPSGRYWSFLTNPTTDEGSWKRYLRGATRDGAEKRDLPRDLWARLDPHVSLEAQLDDVICNSEVSDRWRASLVHYPEAIAFCEARRLGLQDDRFYLLKRTQFNGAHAELFSYCAYLRNRSRLDLLNHLRLTYTTTTAIRDEPSICVTLVLGNRSVDLHILFWDGAYSVGGKLADLQAICGLMDALADLGVAVAGQQITGKIASGLFDDWLKSLNDSVGSLFATTFAAAKPSSA